MAQDFGWSPTVSGLVQSSFFWGYALSQIPGGYLNSNVGGRRVLPTGVGLWSVATAVVPLVGGYIPGATRQTRAALSMLTRTPCCCRLLSAGGGISPKDRDQRRCRQAHAAQLVTL